MRASASVLAKMYGGLFGDLPSAKKQKQTPTASSSASDTSNAKDKKASIESPSTTSSGAKDAKTVGEPARGNLFAPPRQAAAKPNNNKKSQFLQMVGKSGTTMAFVPTAALKAKRKKPAATTTAVNNNKSTNNNSVATNGETTKTVLPKAIISNQQSSFASVATTTTTTRIAVSKSNKGNPGVVVDIHGTGTTMESSQAEPADNTSSLPQTASEITTQEEKITDPYDPYVPNDLLEYWETLAAKKQREKMERDALEALEQQKVLRKQLEEDRKALLHHTVGDAAPLRSMGRGRGVSNLPAWLVEKQKASGSLGVTNEAPSARGRGRGVSNLPAWLVEKQRKEASGGQ